MSTGMFPSRGGRAPRVSNGLATVISQFKGGTSGYQIGNPARIARIQTKPVPPVEQYDVWLDGAVSHDARAKPKVTGTKLRRAVIMIRGGSSVADTNVATGTTLGRWLKMLPPELRV